MGKDNLYKFFNSLGVITNIDENDNILFYDSDSKCNMESYLNLDEDIINIANMEKDAIKITKASQLISNASICLKSASKIINFKLKELNAINQDELFGNRIHDKSLFIQKIRYTIINGKDSEELHEIEISKDGMFGGVITCNSYYDSNHIYHHSCIKLCGNQDIIIEVPRSCGIFSINFDDEWKLKYPEMLNIVKDNQFLNDFIDYIQYEYPQFNDLLNAFYNKESVRTHK